MPARAGAHARQAGTGRAMHSRPHTIPLGSLFQHSPGAAPQEPLQPPPSFVRTRPTSSSSSREGLPVPARARGTCLHLLLQAFLLHSRPSSRTPSQARPSLGRGWQERMRVCRPPPQSLVQSPQADQEFQPPGQDPEKPRQSPEERAPEPRGAEGEPDPADSDMEQLPRLKTGVSLKVVGLDTAG